jgi:hypothetical protein
MVGSATGAMACTEGGRGQRATGVGTRAAGNNTDDERAKAGEEGNTPRAGGVRQASAERRGGACRDMLNARRCQGGSRPPKRRAHAGQASATPRPRL